MQLFIAEKRDVATAIAEALGGGSIRDGAYRIGTGQAVTWLWGHLLRLKEPQEHDEAQYGKWTLDSLPMDWPVQHLPIDQHKDHLQKVVELALQAKEIVNAGDPDPEGQLLVDEVIQYANVTTTPVKRLLINDNNTAAIKKALAKMEPNSKYKGLSDAALARAVCDQHYGFNLTRLYTIFGRQKGINSVLSVGRVQTPILGLVVARDRAHAGHEKQSYFVVEAWLRLNDQDLMLKGSYQVKPDDPVDDKNRLINENHAQGIVDAVKGQGGQLVSVDTQDKQRAAPLPYNLLALQAQAAGFWKYSPRQVLEITQTLRDKYKAITYNRSDSRYLNDERHDEARESLQALTKAFDVAKEADANLKSKAFNSKKVTAHHAIIPTLSVPDLTKLSEAERNIYRLIALQYIAQFYPPEKYRITTVTFESEHHRFMVKGRVDVSPGWKVVFTDPAEEEENEDSAEALNLESLQAGQGGTVEDARSRQEFTKPPPLYTMKTLLQDLTRVARYIKDPAIRELLKAKDADKENESGGIGTPATRDSHIDTLFQRNYITESGKNIISTTHGQQFHDALPAFATVPDMTALWHEKQVAIEAGELDYKAFIDEVDQAIRDEVERAKREGLAVSGSDLTACPVCSEGVLKRRKGKSFFWGCSRYPDCKATYPDKKGKPDLEAKKKPAAGVSAEHSCPQCEKGLSRRPGKKKGSFWWGCSGFPNCKYRAFDDNGKPGKEAK